MTLNQRDPMGFCLCFVVVVVLFFGLGGFLFYQFTAQLIKFSIPTND